MVPDPRDGATDTAAPAPRPVFPAVEPASAVHHVAEHLRERVAADPALQPRPGEDLRAELLPRRRADGTVVLRRAYWSARRPDPASPWGLTARTFHLDGSTGQERTDDFPADPAMDWLARDGDAGALQGHGPGARVEVLRYIPLRRVTFRLTGAVGLPHRVITKTKSAAGLERAHRALTAAHTAAVEAHAEFAVPAPIALDPPRRLLHLEELPGRSLDTQLDALGVDVAMRRLGKLHHGVHALRVPGVGTRTAADWFAAAVTAADQVVMLAPSVASLLERVCAALAVTVPDDDALAFCQGDFVPGQILCAPDRWSVLDLDDGHLADPHSEVAALYTALAYELPVPTDRVEEARDAYVAAYVAAAGRPLDPARWRWFRTVAELRYLARRSIKGRAGPGEADRVLDLLAGRLPVPEVGAAPHG